MTRKEEYHYTMSVLYRNGKDFIKSSNIYYGLKYETLCNSYINLIHEIVHCSFLDDFISLDDFKELSKYADKLIRYLKEYLE